jgi:hypothetical protein
MSLFWKQVSEMFGARLPTSGEDVDALLLDLKARGVRAKDAVRQAAETTGRSHRDVMPVG